MKKNLYYPFLFFVFVCLYSCNEMIDYSPYDTDVDSKKINVKNVNFLNKQTEITDTLKIALFSDSHIAYDELHDAIKSINKQEGLQFAVCCGDITDQGLKSEFIWYHDIIEKCRYPVITVHGNHDYRSNGHKVYEKMFGPSNMTFTYMGYKFIVFDDVVWENNNSSPRFDWLEQELSTSEAPGILMAHIPPWTDQLEGEYSVTFGEIISESNLILNLYGHQHSFSQQVFAGVPSVVSDDILGREYYIIKIYGLHHKVERIRF